MVSGAMTQAACLIAQFRATHFSIAYGICQAFCTSVLDPQVRLEQRRSSPGIGISTYLPSECPHVPLLARDGDVSSSTTSLNLPFFVTIETQFQKFGIAPPSAAEMTAAMQGTSGSKKGHLTQQDQAADGAQGSQVPVIQGQPTQTTQGQHPAAATQEQSGSVVVGCSVLYLVDHRPITH
ncbi:hypothetical protein P692DRAFT_20171887 [Suillus brevipes Sb2]|jgi:hypothetical protein|nr:hypothetical protein P692DRAFT_20171887 [Suillus brevipes Sb2]